MPGPRFHSEKWQDASLEPSLLARSPFPARFLIRGPMMIHLDGCGSTFRTRSREPPMSPKGPVPLRRHAFLVIALVETCL
jgi:hypothetical protein